MITIFYIIGGILEIKKIIGLHLLYKFSTWSRTKDYQYQHSPYVFYFKQYAIMKLRLEKDLFSSIFLRVLPRNQILNISISKEWYLVFGKRTKIKMATLAMST